MRAGVNREQTRSLLTWFAKEQVHAGGLYGIPSGYLVPARDGIGKNNRTPSPLNLLKFCVSGSCRDSPHLDLAGHRVGPNRQQLPHHQIHPLLLHLRGAGQPCRALHETSHGIFRLSECVVHRLFAAIAPRREGRKISQTNAWCRASAAEFCPPANYHRSGSPGNTQYFRREGRQPNNRSACLFRTGEESRGGWLAVVLFLGSPGNIPIVTPCGCYTEGCLFALRVARGNNQRST